MKTFGFQLKYKSSICNILQRKVVSSESGEKYAQAPFTSKHRPKQL